MAVEAALSYVMLCSVTQAMVCLISHLTFRPWASLSPPRNNLFAVINVLGISKIESCLEIENYRVSGEDVFFLCLYGCLVWPPTCKFFSPEVQSFFCNYGGTVISHFPDFERISCHRVTLCTLCRQKQYFTLTNMIHFSNTFHSILSPQKDLCDSLLSLKWGDIRGNIKTLNHVFHNRPDCAWNLLYMELGDTATNRLASFLKLFR